MSYLSYNKPQTGRFSLIYRVKEERLLLIESYAIREQEIMDKYDQMAAPDQKAKDDEFARQKVIDDQKLCRPTKVY